MAISASAGYDNLPSGNWLPSIYSQKVLKFFRRSSVVEGITNTDYTGEIENKQMRIGEHSDYGTITLLWQINDVPGLEVLDLDNNWHPVPYADNGVVCNIGDLLQRWTNDYFKSTKHRVVNTHIDQERWSMPHFVDPKPGTMVENLTSQPAKYEPIESLAYLKWRLAQSY